MRLCINTQLKLPNTQLILDFCTKTLSKTLEMQIKVYVKHNKIKAQSQS